MALDRREPTHAAWAKPLLQAIDQCRAIFRVVAMSCGSKVGLRWLDRLDNGGGEPERLEAETELDRFRDALELEVEQTCDMRGVARRHAEADVDGRDLAVDTVERKPQGARADAVA